MGVFAYWLYIKKNLKILIFSGGVPTTDFTIWIQHFILFCETFSVISDIMEKHTCVDKQRGPAELELSR